MKPSKFKSPPKLQSNPELYAQNIDACSFYDNTLNTALPQTCLYDLVLKHFEKGDKIKKALICGWDGARADALAVLSEDAEVFSVGKKGKFLLTYTGGEKGKLSTRQHTDTAPGWASWLTGVWANRHFVRNNGNICCKSTFLKTLSLRGQKTVFNYLWSGHDLTYRLERHHSKTISFNRLDIKNLSVEEGDEKLTLKMIDDIKNDADLIFGIFENPDSTGHAYGFDKDIPEYATAIKNCDLRLNKLILEIKNRPSFLNEDWLVVVMSDHGGFGKAHGMQISECRTVFLSYGKL